MQMYSEEQINLNCMQNSTKVFSHIYIQPFPYMSWQDFTSKYKPIKFL